MAYSSDYTERILKKKKKINQNNRAKNTTTSNKDSNTYSSSYTKKVLSGDYKGVLKSMQTSTAKNTAKKEDKKWYQKILQAPETFKDNLDRFDDGYNFGDITGTIGETLWDTGKTILGTGVDIGTSAVKGVTDIGQNAAKLGAGAIAQVADWIGQDEYAERVRNNIAGKNEKTNEFLKKYTPSGIMQNWNDKVEGSSIIGETGDKVFESVGYIGGIAATGGIAGNGMATATMFSSSSGNALGESYQKENVEDWQAWTKAIGSGAIETVSERLFGIFGTSGLDKAVANKVSSKLTSGMAKALARQGIQATGEALEEFISYAGNQGLDLIIDKANEVTGGDGAKFKEEWNWEDLGEQMAVAFLASGTIGGGANVASISDIKSQTGMSTNEAVNELGRRQDIEGEIENVSGEINALQKKLAKEKNQAKIQEIQQEITTKQAHITELNSLLQPTTNVQDNIAPVQEQPVNTTQNVQDIDSQIAILEEQLMATESETEYQKLSNQIKELEQRAEQLEQQNIAPVQETQQEAVEDLAPTREIIPPTVEQELTNITNQIDELETMLDTKLNATQQQEVLTQIKTLEQRYNEILQQNQTQDEAVFKTASQQDKAQNAEIAPIQEASAEQISQPTTQAVESNSLVEAESNTQNIENAGDLVQIASTTNDTQNIANEPQVMTEEEYLSSKGYGAMGYSEPGLHKSSARVSQNTRDKQASQVQEKAQEYDAKREELRKEYQEKLKSGEIRKPTNVEKLLRTAQGHEDNQSVQSARKLLEKRGIDWKTGEKINKENKTPTQEELDNLENTRLNKSGSEYASAFYDLEKKYGSANLYKGLNEYKSTGKALVEEIAPIKAELSELASDLKETIKDTKKELKTLTKELNEVKTSVSEVQEGFKAVTEADLPMLEQQWNEDFRNIDESNMPSEIEDTTPDIEDAITETKDLFDIRDYSKVGDRKLNAYQYDNPEVKPFFQDAAISMYQDLEMSTKGERYIIGDISQMGNGDYEYTGTKRHTADDIAELLDGVDGKYKLSYKEIEKGLDAIIKDEGAENNAASKRIEFFLDQRLRNGYTTLDGHEVPPNQEYLNTLQGIEFDNYYSSLPTEDIAPLETIVEGETTQESIIAPVTENVAKNPVNQSLAIEQAPDSVDNGGPMIRVSPEIEKRTLNKPTETKNVNWEALEDTSKGEQQHLKVKKLGETLEQRDVEWDSLEDTSKAKQKQYNPETGQFEDAIEKKTKKEIKEKLLKDTGIMNASLDNANNISKLLMENTDPIRLQEMVFGRGLGTEINNMFFQKVKDNTSEKIRFQNKERAEIKDLGIKARSKESAAVQKYGEKQWVNDKGETLPYGDKELMSEFPDIKTQEKIKNASKVIRQKYDNYIDTTNKVLTDLGYDAIPKRADYMRHFQELNDIFSRVGIPYNYNEMTANDLPTDINGLTADFSPSKNFFASALERTGNKTTYDAITGVDGYLEGIGNLIYHTEDIQRLRAYEQYIRDTYGQNHGFDNLEQLTDEEKVQRVEKIQDNHLSNYASWLHEYTNTLAGKKALIDRSIEGLTGRKIYSFLNTTKTQVGRNMIGFNIGSAMTNAIAGVQTLAKTNKLATVKGLADTIKNTFVKDGFVEKNNFLTSRFGSDRLSKNLWQKVGDAGFVFMQGTDYFVSNFVVRSKYNELKAKGLSDTQAHIEAGKYASRLMSDRSQGATPNIYNSQMLGLVTQFQNEVNNQLYSMFYDTYHESKESANGNALKTAAGMTFTLGQMAVFTHLFGKAFESIAGYNPTFDIIGMLMKAFGFDDDEENEDTALDNVSQAFGQLVDALPYVNILTGGGRVPVSEAFTGVTDTFKALTGGKDEYGQDVEWSDAWGSIKESAPYFLLPSGYSQIKKTTKGLGMYDEDLPIAGSYTDSGNLRFTADDSTWGKIQAGIFGQWASEEAQEYVDSDFKTINKSNIEEMLDLGMISSEYRKLKENITKAGKTTEAKVDYIATLNELTNSQKNTLVNNILDRDYEVDVSNYEDYGSYDEFNFYVKNPEKYDWLQSKGVSYEEYSATDESKELYNYAYRYPETYEVGKAITGDFATYKAHADYIWDLKADKDENGDSISGTKKTKVISYVNSLDLSIPQKAMLIRKTYSTFDDYNNEIVDYVASLDLDYETKAIVLNELDFTIDEDGYVYWK